MNRRSFLKSTLAATTASAFAQSRQGRTPNVVLILVDDFGYECLGCNGALDYKTPNIDALAAKGVRFTNAHSTPLCTPTRVQLMTGKYNFRNYTEFGSLKQGEYTFAHLMRDAGYKTGVAGKWQLAGAIPGTQYKGVGSTPEQAGFDEHCLWQVKDRGSRFWDPTVQENGVLKSELKGKYGPDLFVNFATSFFERHRNRPFFFYYAMALTHDPFVPTPKSSNFTEAQKQKNDTAWFADMVAYTDDCIGKLLAQIDRLGLSKDTIFLITGDNGTHPTITTNTKNGPYQGAKGNTITAGTHVPFIAYWEGRTPKGKVNEDLIDFTDFFPTLAEAGNAKIPTDHPKDGRSFLPQLTGKKGNPRDHIFCHYAPRWGRFAPARWAMDKKWKLYEDGRFFDLVNDEREKNPITALTPEMEKAKARFQSVLASMQSKS